MALLKINTLEGGTNGVDVSNANSGGASFDNLTNITKTDATATLKYASAAAAWGSMGIEAICGAVAAQAYAELAVTSQAEVVTLFFLKVSSLTTCRPIRVFGTAGSSAGLVGSLQVTSGGIVRWLDSNGATRGSIATAISAGTTYLVALHVKPGTIGGANTQVEVYLYNASTRALIDSASSTTAETLSTDITNVRFGITSQSVASLTVGMDYLRVDSGATIPAGPVEQTGTTLINALTTGPRGVGALTAAAVSTVTATASAGGTGTATASAVRTVDAGTGTAPGVGALTASGSGASTGDQNRLFETHILYETAVTWGGTPAGFVEVDGGTVSIGGHGLATSSGFGDRQGLASLAGAGTTTGTGRGESTGVGSPTGFGSATATGRGESTGTASIGGVGALFSAATPTQLGTAVLQGTGAAAVADEAQEKLAAATATGVGTIAATSGIRDALGIGLPTGVGTLVLGDVFAGPPDPPRGTIPNWEPRPPAWDVLPPAREDYPAPQDAEVAFDTLDAAGRVAYSRALRYSRRARVRVVILDSNEAPVVDLGADDAVVYDGSIQIDTTQAIARRLSLNIADPTRALVEFDSASANAPVSPSGFVHVERIDQVPELGLFVSVPLIRGAVTRFERTGPDVILEAMGKESRLLKPAALWASITIGRGTRIVDAIRRLAQAMGETRFRLPEVSTRLTSPLSLVRGQSVWPTIQRLALTLGRDVYYDAAGNLTARVRPTTPAWTFTDAGEDSNVLPPGADVVYDVTNVRNAVQVLGRIPGKGNRPAATAVAPPDHPLSPESMARNGRPLYLFERVEADHLTRSADCLERARDLLASYLIAGTSASFAAVVNPLMEVRDVATLTAGGVDVPFRITTATVPITGALMQVGDVTRIPSRRRHRTRAGVSR